MQIWDVESHLNALAKSESELSHGASTSFNVAPLVKYRHKDEGYAIDWSPMKAGRLLSGTLLRCLTCFTFYLGCCFDECTKL